MNSKPPQQRITLDLGEKEAEGIYANMTLITHSPAEFILDFARLVPGLPKSKVHARIIMTPQAAKALQLSLAGNIERFETNHGEIKLAGQPNPAQNIGFHTD
ncbi:DUF3467 domain-containing protein [bacterium]|nr:DUF3467 domain-containing protein [bacterium]PIV81240.1 MAG: DUF3467 domain-containing protein [bacterium CG17_big_fil_post_rev_8_21_14_2_50_64_8]PJA75621.1 MAG: DUF3467 domain-containing protein [bacterium CG_4_9_14_3_um_filter_65_15]